MRWHTSAIPISSAKRTHTPLKWRKKKAVWWRERERRALWFDICYMAFEMRMPCVFLFCHLNCKRVLVYYSWAMRVMSRGYYFGLLINRALRREYWKSMWCSLIFGKHLLCRVLYRCKEEKCTSTPPESPQIFCHFDRFISERLDCTAASRKSHSPFCW